LKCISGNYSIAGGDTLPGIEAIGLLRCFRRYLVTLPKLP